MSRHTRSNLCLALCFVMLATGCQPQQPFFFGEDGDLSHYIDVSTDIEYPDVEEPTLDEVTHAQRPLSLKNMDNYEIWDLSLEEATRITLCNSNVMRQLGGRVASSAPDTLSRTIVNAASVTTTYDPALVETGSGQSFGSQFDGLGVESALSEFDAQLQSSVLWNYNDRPQNAPNNNPISPPVLRQDLGNFNLSVAKTNATGGRWGFQNTTAYDSNNLPTTIRQTPSDWQTNFEAFFSQPLFQGRGTQYNRIAGPYSFDQYAANAPNSFDGVVIARIRTDLTLADFEGGVRNYMRDVEQAYWELYFAYRDLEARKQGLESARRTWFRLARTLGAGVGTNQAEARARAQYYQFRAEVEQALTQLFRAENTLRYIMGLSVSDGRLIRPADEPTIARVDFDWAAAHCEALARRVEVRKQKWWVKRREVELIAARNHLLPRIDAVGRYRWLGGGDELIAYDGIPPFAEGSSAFESLLTGDFQEWELGFQVAIPIGFRRQLDGVRHVQLLLARERAILQDLELEVSHQLGSAVQDVDLFYQTSQSRFNGRIASKQEEEAYAQLVAAGAGSSDNFEFLLDAQRRRAEAESAYYRSLVDYNLAILDVHWRKGSLLDFNGVYLAEGPWPGKAYFDALRRARQRDASMYLDYGFTRPNVMSRGPVSQGIGSDSELAEGGVMYDAEASPEMVPAGEPTPADGTDAAWPPADAGAMLDYQTDGRDGIELAGYERPMDAPIVSGAQTAGYTDSSPQAHITYAASPAHTRPSDGHIQATLNPHAPPNQQPIYESDSYHSPAEVATHAAGWRDAQPGRASQGVPR